MAVIAVIVASAWATAPAAPPAPRRLTILISLDGFRFRIPPRSDKQPDCPMSGRR